MATAQVMIIKVSWTTLDGITVTVKHYNRHWMLWVARLRQVDSNTGGS